MNDHESCLLDSASGGTFIDKTIDEATSIIDKLANSCIYQHALSHNGRNLGVNRRKLIDVKAAEPNVEG